MWRTFSRTVVKARAVTPTTALTTRATFVQFFAFHSLANKENPSRFESSYQRALDARIKTGETFSIPPYFSLID
jgi:hypothetical protein